jgi:heterodisulfide reductase subunit A
MTELGYRLPDGVRTLELPCTGRINDAILLENLQNGSRGVMVVGCRKDNCKYLDGNLRAELRAERATQMLADAGILDRQISVCFVAPDEGKRLNDELAAFSDTLGRNTGK